MKIHGKYTLDEDKDVVCTCGEKNMFWMVAHFDFPDKALTNYKCMNYGNVIETVVEREETWDDYA